EGVEGKSYVSQHLSGAHGSIPLFCPSFPSIATTSQGTISGWVFGEFQCCDRFGVLAVLHCGARFPNRHGGFPVLTAAALRHLVRRLDAAPPAHADADSKRPHLPFCSHTQCSGQWPRGI